MTLRFTSRSLAGTSRKLVAVGTPRLASMFATMRAAAPRIGVPFGSTGSTAAGAAAFAGAFAGAEAAGGAAGEGAGAVWVAPPGASGREAAKDSRQAGRTALGAERDCSYISSTRPALAPREGAAGRGTARTSRRPATGWHRARARRSENRQPRPDDTGVPGGSRPARGWGPRARAWVGSSP